MLFSVRVSDKGSVIKRGIHVVLVCSYFVLGFERWLLVGSVVEVEERVLHLFHCCQSRYCDRVSEIITQLKYVDHDRISLLVS